MAQLDTTTVFALWDRTSVRPKFKIDLVDPDIHNSNPGEFKGRRLPVQAHDLRFPEDEALEAVRRFMATYCKLPTSRSWVAAGLAPSETRSADGSAPSRRRSRPPWIDCK